MSEMLAPEDAAQAAVEALLNDPNDWARKFFDAWPKNYFSVGRTCDAIGIARRSPKTRCGNDPVFAVLYDEMMEQARDTIRYELNRRAIEPSERPIYQGGILVDTVLEYDNRHLEWLAERLMPEEYHLPLRIEFARPDDSDFTFRMGESDDVVELPAGDVTDSEEQ